VRTGLLYARFGFFPGQLTSMVEGQVVTQVFQCVHVTSIMYEMRST